LTNPSCNPLAIRWLGRVAYARGLELQDSLVIARRREESPDTLLLLEHPPVITLGRSSDRAHVLIDDANLAGKGIELYESGRGGDVTFHGPGQLVGYPIVAIPRERRDAHRYLRDLEEALIRCVGEYGITARREPGLTGIWVDEGKLAAIGVRLNTGWITSHGFALNVATDLAGFSNIVPCGIADRGVTSLARLLGTTPSLEEVAARVARQLGDVLDLEPVPSSIPEERLAGIVAGSDERRL